MVVYIRAALRALQGHLAASGHCPGGAMIGEPRAPVASQAGAVIIDRYDHPETDLTGSIETRWITVRFYRDFLNDPREEEAEGDLDAAVADFQSALFANFDFDVSGVRAIRPTLVSANTGYTSIGQTQYRIADIHIPLIVDDSAAFSA